MMAHTNHQVEKPMAVVARDEHGLYVVCAGINYITTDEIEALSRSGRTLSGNRVISVFTTMAELLAFVEMFRVPTGRSFRAFSQRS